MFKNIKTAQMLADENLEKQTAEANALALQELAKLDLESIRAMREWIASQPTAPKILKDKEAAAITSRAKLK